jgi:hypothetical protein
VVSPDIPIDTKAFDIPIIIVNNICHIFVSSPLAMSWLVVTSATMNALASILMIPSLLAVIISAWMNIVIFVNRMEK